MVTNIITSQEQIVKIRPNLWQLDTGHVVGYGPLTAPGGLYYCFNCKTAGCQHIATVDTAWVAGEDSAEIPFNGVTDEPLGFEGDELTFVSGAGMFAEADYGLEAYV